MLQGREFVAIPAGSWYNFNKVAQYKQLTLEEAEEKMRNRRKTADGYERWMMKAANNGAAAFGEVEKIDEKEVGSGSGRGGRKKNGGDDEEANASDRGEEDEDEEAARKSRLGLNKKGGDDDDDEGPRGGDFDNDDDIERGDDWEHEEIFTDDDEATAVHPEEREDLAPEIPAPPEIKNDEDDEEEGDEEDGGGLSKSGKELKKLLGRANGLNDSDAEDDDDDDDDMDDDMSPVLAPKHKEAVKEEPVENITSAKSTASASARGTPPTSKSAKGKRKINNEDPKATNGAPLKKVKSENEVKPVKSETPTKSTATPKVVPQQPSPKSTATPSTGTVTEEEIKAVLLQTGLITTQELVAKFKLRLKTKEDKDAFAAILRRISKIQKTGGSNYVVLRK
ncbi:OLC1v1020828C2 [Oldenlandia corymbosa var. corymbosa]|nr:OLC1v1020828C2 [Oldenlandia corymbosa var. corymbosa]